MREMEELFAALGKSAFRSRFRLRGKDAAHLAERGVDAVCEHARKIIGERLAPANPAKDGKQTPMRGHPVFVAQHATGTCCRSCLLKWHGLSKNKELNSAEREYVVSVIRHWLQGQVMESKPRQPGLFDC
jgi:hypothetical protein